MFERKGKARVGLQHELKCYDAVCVQSLREGDTKEKFQINFNVCV